MARVRLDDELVARGFFATKDDALRAVMAGKVSTSNRRFSSAAEKVTPGLELHVRAHDAYVSRGGQKLAAALDNFAVSPKDCSCLDIGCSTGGFTDCLLRRGAAHVVAVDVGYAQFDWSLRNDPRVTLLERTNIIALADPADPADTKRPAGARFARYVHSFDLAVCDVSFTSIITIADAVAALLRLDAEFITLVKPQFEAAKEQVDAGGVVHDPAVWLDCLQRVSLQLSNRGFSLQNMCASPLVGHKGNHEFLLHTTYVGIDALQAKPPKTLDFDRVIAQARSD